MYVKDSLNEGLENQNLPIQEKSADYIGGTIEYSIVGYSNNNQPVLIVPGFTEGRFVLQDFAEALSEQGNCLVLFPDQPILERKQAGKMSVIDQHANALLKIIEAENLSDQPIDIITHSFGSLIAARMAELAKEQGYSTLDSNKGSRSVFIAPAGSNSKENLLYHGGRWAKFMARSLPYGKELDLTSEMMKAGAKNLLSNPLKTSKEVVGLGKKEKIYKGLGKSGLRPFILGYAADDMYPHKVIESVIQENGDNLVGYSMPIDSGGVGAENFKQFQLKTGLSGKEAKKAWSHHYRNAGHNDLLFHPDRTVKAILQLWERNNAIPRV
jgi:pimeloyl-ACP methyl ester carboxylesterase